MIDQESRRYQIEFLTFRLEVLDPGIRNGDHDGSELHLRSADVHRVPTGGG